MVRKEGKKRTRRGSKRKVGGKEEERRRGKSMGGKFAGKEEGKSEGWKYIQRDRRETGKRKGRVWRGGELGGRVESWWKEDIH